MTEGQNFRQAEMEVNHRDFMAKDTKGHVEEYVFVNLVDSYGLGKTARATIQSQVTRDHYRCSKDPINPVHLTETSLEEAVVKPEKQMNRFRLGPEGLRETAKRPKSKGHRHTSTDALGAMCFYRCFRYFVLLPIL